MKNIDYSHVFIKVNVSTIRGRKMLAVLGPELTHTLLGLASFLPDARPSQSYLSSILGITPTATNKRIRRLAAFRDETGAPVIKISKTRNQGKFLSNKYEILVTSGISMFE